MINVTNVTVGFEVQTADGVFCAWCEHFDDALRSMKAIDEAEQVRRVRDDELLATKWRIRGVHFYEALWKAA